MASVKLEVDKESIKWPKMMVACDVPLCTCHAAPAAPSQSLDPGLSPVQGKVGDRIVGNGYNRAAEKRLISRSGSRSGHGHRFSGSRAAKLCNHNELSCVCSNAAFVSESAKVPKVS